MVNNMAAFSIHYTSFLWSFISIISTSLSALWNVEWARFVQIWLHFSSVKFHHGITRQSSFIHIKMVFRSEIYYVTMLTLYKLKLLLKLTEKQQLQQQQKIYYRILFFQRCFYKLKNDWQHFLTSRTAVFVIANTFQHRTIIRPIY